jgi:thioredoxin-related protein
MKKFLTLLASIVFTAVSVSASEMGDDGLHKTAWMRDTFKDLREDLAEANAEGKRFMILVEQRGCIYCKKMHEETFPHPVVEKMITENFFVVQLNLHGDIEITDFDGEVLSEKAAARKWGLLFTPTMFFLPEEVAEDMTAVQAAVAMMPGAFGPGTTQDMLTWVIEKRYELEGDEDFQRYHARRIQERNNGKTD